MHETVTVQMSEADNILMQKSCRCVNDSESTSITCGVTYSKAVWFCISIWQEQLVSI